MYETCLVIGNTSTLIKTHPSCLSDNMAIVGELNVREQNDFECHVLPICEKRQTILKVPSILSNYNFEGIYRNIFITYMYKYGLIAETNLSENFIRIYLKNGILNWKSYYLIRSIIRKHIIRLIFCRDDAVIHASSLYMNRLHCGMIIVGESGSGKSSMIWNLLNSMDATLVSDDISVISKESGYVSGEGGNLYVRPDFIERYNISESQYRVVSAERKYELSIHSKAQLQFIPKYVCVVKNVSSVDFVKVSPNDIFQDIMQVHRNWYYNDHEKCVGINNIKKMLANIKAGFICNLNADNINTMKKTMLSD